MSERIKQFKRTTIYNTSNIKTIMTEKWQVVLLISLFTAGIFIGSFFINNAEGEIVTKISSIMHENFSGREKDTSLQLFTDAFIKYAVFLLLTFFFGLCGLGYPIVATVPLLCGIANGLMSGYLYQSFGLHGLFYCLLTIYPSLAISVTSLIIGACESMEMSKTILAILIDKHHKSTETPLKRYAYQYSILTSIVIFSCITETVLCHFFLNKFLFFS